MADEVYLTGCGKDIIDAQTHYELDTDFDGQPGKIEITQDTVNAFSQLYGKPITAAGELTFKAEIILEKAPTTGYRKHSRKPDSMRAVIRSLDEIISVSF